MLLFSSFLQSVGILIGKKRQSWINLQKYIRGLTGMIQNLISDTQTYLQTYLQTYCRIQFKELKKNARAEIN